MRKCMWSRQGADYLPYRTLKRLFGHVTTENTKTRAWFCCREVVLVSEHFNFLEVRGSFLDASYLAYLTTLKKLLVDSYTMAEATLMGGAVNEAAWSDTAHQGVIQQIDQVLADPRCEALTLYPLSAKCHETQEADKVSTK